MFLRFGSWRVGLAAGLAGLSFCSTMAQDRFAGTATPVSALKVAKDFRVELLHTVPKDNEGSWVAMCTDPKGRLIVSDQYGPLYRITLPPLGTTNGLKIDKIDLPIGQAQGLLYAFDSLYVMVANEAFQGRGLYRVRDTNGDDRFDEVKLLRKLDGGGEHGPHAIVPTPDGKGLFIIVGNQTKITELSGSQVPKHWGEDLLLPRLWDGNGFMKGVLGPGGWVAKIDPEGKNWDLQTVGFRNEYDAAVHRDGDLFTFDADMEWDMNTPWYRPTRICFVASGADFGWRSGASKWPSYYPDTLPPVVDIGPGSPTGVTFGYGAKFPAKYQNAYFASDWSYGKLYAVHIEPDGAGYMGTAEEFITGQPLPLTDVLINPLDGAMYFAIGGRKTQSALYRVTYAGSESTAPSNMKLAGGTTRELRRKLESFHGRPDPKAVDAAWPFLGHADRYLNTAARVAIEWQPVATWRERALAETKPDASINALIALVRASATDEPHRKPSDPKPDPSLQPAVLAALDRLDESKAVSANKTQQLGVLRAYALTFIRLGRPDDATRLKLAQRFESRFPAQSAPATSRAEPGNFPGATAALNLQLGEMLVYLAAPQAATKLMAALEKAPSQEEQLAYAKMLRVLRTGWTPALREAYFNWYVKAANFRGGASLAGFLRDMKNDAIATLSDAEKIALKPILDAKPPKRTALENLLTGRQVVKEWQVNDLTPSLTTGLQHRNYDRGRELFGAVGCYNCHRFATEGGAVGPDLTGIAGRFNPRDLLESVVDPNKEISDQYQAILVTKNDGETVIGRVANLNDDSIMIATDMTDPNAFADVKRKDVKSIEPSKVSPMPEGLLNTLKEDEILDLLAFLLSQGDRSSKYFR
ncbi:MAG TPA: c-type cytochrome [Verrucomicrobiota bacterium]|nr:heme-binding protein [Verrucomicrobiales bacterium]HRI11469.1 c-type cytochrome [Verrucomicrobiota bacterium]